MTASRERVVILDIDVVLNRHRAPLSQFGWFAPQRGSDRQWVLALPTDPTRKLATFLGILDEDLVARAGDLVRQADAEVVIASG